MSRGRCHVLKWVCNVKWACLWLWEYRKTLLRQLVINCVCKFFSRKRFIYLFFFWNSKPSVSAMYSLKFLAHHFPSLVLCWNSSEEGDVSMQHIREYMARCSLRHTRLVTYQSLSAGFNEVLNSFKDDAAARGTDRHTTFHPSHQRSYLIEWLVLLVLF